MDWVGSGQTGAVFDPTEVYRYTLWRRWEECELDRMCAFVCLNPSTATAEVSDPTVTRCINFSKKWGFGGFIMLNLFAIRETDRKLAMRHPEPVGDPENARAIEWVSQRVGRVVCAWGTDGYYHARDFLVSALLRRVGVRPYCLKLTSGGHPYHPLYVRGDIEPVLFREDYFGETRAGQGCSGSDCDRREGACFDGSDHRDDRGDSDDGPGSGGD